MAYTDYTVIRSNARDITADVLAAMAQGYQPFGSLQVDGEFLIQPVVLGTPDGGGGGTVTTADITDSGATGRTILQSATQAGARSALGVSAVGSSLMSATDAAAGRSAIGAGTSNLAIGTTSTTAKAGDYQPTAANISDAGAVGRLVLQAANQPTAQTAIGATVTGRALIGAVDAAAGRSAIGVQPATNGGYGIVKTCTSQADSTATDVAGLLTDFNALLGRMRTAALITVN